MSAPRTETGPTERFADIIEWRRSQLTASGFAPDLAAELAAGHEVDLHAVLQLIDQGCPPKLAARILAPLDRPTTERCSQ
jgi:hypothetical protein